MFDCIGPADFHKLGHPLDTFLLRFTNIVFRRRIRLNVPAVHEVEMHAFAFDVRGCYLSRNETANITALDEVS